MVNLSSPPNPDPHPGADTPEALLAAVYDELRRLAARKMAAERAGHTLQPTALVHEAWLRLGGTGTNLWHNRAHFFAAAAEAMRRILIDHARRRLTERHGGGQVRVSQVPDDIAAAIRDDDQLLAMHEVLDRLEAEDPRRAQVVKLRFFAGLTNEETAQVLDVSLATVKRDWDYARAWLFAALQRGC